MAEFGPGDLFGEVALLSSASRSASVRCTEELEVIALEGQTFLSLVDSGGHDREQTIEEIRIHLFVRRLPTFAALTARSMSRLQQSLRIRHHQAGETVMAEGQTGAAMYVIYEGTCEVTAGGRRVAVLGRGELVGEIAVVTGQPRTATVQCMEPSVLVELAGDVYREILVDEFATGFLIDREVDERLRQLSQL